MEGAVLRDTVPSHPPGVRTREVDMLDPPPFPDPAEDPTPPGGSEASKPMLAALLTHTEVPSMLTKGKPPGETNARQTCCP